MGKYWHGWKITWRYGERREILNREIHGGVWGNGQIYGVGEWGYIDPEPIQALAVYFYLEDDEWVGSRESALTLTLKKFPDYD